MARSLCALVLLSACGDDDAPLDPAEDAQVEIDAALDAGIDASEVDASVEDDASIDSAVEEPGFGSIEGPCGRLLALLDDEGPSVLETHLDFGTDGYDDPDERGLLTPGAREILMEGTAGGSSGISEAFAFELLARCEAATLLKSETEVVYDPPTSKKTDILVDIDGMRVGVSVTRAESYPRDADYTAEDAAFIERKLDDILISSMNVVAEDRWVKQVLLVVAYSDMHADVVREVWDGVDAATRADTVLYLVVTNGDDEIIY